MTLSDWREHMTSKVIAHNDAVRLLKDAEAEIERYAALLDAYQHERNHYDATVSKLNTDNLRISKDYDRMLAGVAEIAQAAGVSGSAPNICRETVKAVNQLTEERDALRAALRELTEGYRLLVNADNQLTRAAMGEFMDMAVIRIDKMLGETS